MKHLNPTPLVTLTLIVASHHDNEAPKSFSRREGATIVIGRSSRSGGETPASDNALFRNQVLSRSHATFTWQKDGSIFITDTKSTHGTIVQRSPRQIVVGPQPIRLLDGDQLILGKTVTRANENKTAVNYEPLILKVSIAPDRKADPRSALLAVPAAAPRRYALQTQEQLFTDDEEDEQAEGGQDVSELNALNPDGGYKFQRKSSYGRQSPSPELKERVDQFMKNRKRTSQSPEQQYDYSTKEPLSKPAKRPTPIVISGSESGCDASQSPLPFPSSPDPAEAEQTREFDDDLCMPKSSQPRGSDEDEDEVDEVDKGEKPSNDDEADPVLVEKNEAVKVPESDFDNENSGERNASNNDIEDMDEDRHESLLTAAIERQAVPSCEFSPVVYGEDSEEEQSEMEGDEDEDEDRDEDEDEDEDMSEEKIDEDDEVVSRRRMVIESDEEDGNGSGDESDEADDPKLQKRNDQHSEEDEVSEDSSQIFDPKPTPPYKPTRQRDKAPASSNTSSDNEPLLKKVRLDAVESQESEISQSLADFPDTQRFLPTQLHQTEIQPGLTRASDLLVNDPTLGSAVNVLQAKKFKKPMRDAGVQAEVPSKISMAVQTVIVQGEVEMQAENHGEQDPESVLSLKKRTHDVMSATDDMKAAEGLEESTVITTFIEPELRPKRGLPLRAAARYTSVFALGALAAVVGLAAIPELD